MDKGRIQKALDALVYLPHLKEKALHAAISPVREEEGGKGRVWDSGDLFRRLQTYKPATWFCKPDAISPAECARRGWLNTAADMLTCEFCKAKVSCPIPPQLLPEEASETAARYAEQLTQAHDAACPWRTNCCAASLLQFPPLTQEATRDNFAKRLASLQRLVCLPPLAAQAYERAAADGQRRALDQLLLRGPWGSSGAPLPPEQQRRRQEQEQGAAGGAGGAEGERGGSGGTGGGSSSSGEEVRARLCEGGVAAWNTDSYETRLRLLALCGWDLKVVAAGGDSGSGEASIGGTGSTAMAAQQGQQGQPHVGPECTALLCALCGAKAGLWAYFPSCKPQVQPAPGRGLSLRGAQSGRPGSGTTIAGGLLSSPPGAAAAPSGPFGGSRSAGVPLFGPPPPGLPPAASSGDAAAGAVAAELAAAGGSPAGEAGTAEAAKRKQGSLFEPAGAGGASEPAEKRSRGEASTPAAAAAASSARPTERSCATEAVQQYSSMDAVPLDPLALHRPFCPWVNQGQAAAEGQQPARCGWKWSLQQLMPGADDGASLLSSQAGGEGKEWDPAKLMKAVLRRVDVHK